MNKKVIGIIILVVFVLSAITGAIVLVSNDSLSNKTNENYTNTINIESVKEMISKIKVIINGKTYSAKIEDNETGQSFTNMMPQEYKMSELNGNEKYIYLDNDLPTNSYNPKHIESGDIMLYGNNCLVVFYKSFDTSYSYTKIGHIEDLPDLGNGNVIIRFE